jgi:hypothetical protein
MAGTPFQGVRAKGYGPRGEDPRRAADDPGAGSAQEHEAEGSLALT